MNAPLDLVLFAGTPFSGSTILQAELGRSDDAIVLGEVDRLRCFARHEHLSGDAGIYIDECEFCRLAKRPCPVWTKPLLDAVGRTGGTPDLYREVAAATGRRVIIDGSKSPHWIASILASPALEGIRVHLVHCVKHPFAYALSLSKRTHWPEPHCVFDWTLVNGDVLSIAARHSARIDTSTLVRVEDFERDPEATIASIGRRMGLTFGTAIAPHNLHFLGGNPRMVESMHARLSADGGYAAGAVPYKSSDWREQIGPELRQRFAGLPGVAPLASILGYPLP
ncbi:MAG: hypothetical protein ACO3NL_10380 [Phycisphaerales bacterium]